LAGFISPALKEQVFRDWGSNRGLGWQCGELYPHGGWGHTGFTGSYLYLNIQSGSIISILTNRQNVLQPRIINDFRIALANACLAKPG